MVTMNDVRVAASEIFPDAVVVDLWLVAPNPDLGGFSPSQMVDAGHGSAVLALIDGIAEGITA